MVTRDEFFAEPNYWYFLRGESIPDEWVAAAWEELPEFRDNFTYAIVRQASKVGDLGASESALEFLAGILPLARMVELYEQVRAGSPHREPEFRPAFERAFGERMAAFPPPLTNQQIIAALGEDLAERLGVLDEDARPDQERPAEPGAAAHGRG